MKTAIQKLLVFLAIATMATAADQAGDPTTAAATATVTEQACMGGGGALGDTTPLAIARALATAADVSEAASAAASLMAENQYGGLRGGAGAPTVIPDTMTVTTFASATDCPPEPTLTLDDGEFARLYSEELDRLLPPNDTDTTDDTAAGAEKRWAKGRLSLCFTGSDVMLAGRYGLWLDGWGQEADGCGKGALDNLRGHCGSIEQWECMHWGSGVVLTFWAIAPRYSGCVIDAMWQASPHAQREKDLCCAYVGPGLISMGKHKC
ncbi:hypothetical protein KVR01_009618 [Diaporthe batatas]|uniref:uncharacterized protein n=1 Tax=Diaporthe batatas TaxID=748121 RepID=UPI001D050F24|nr:uncharacterized protein KVR01_009618 [Diaporthe batatas]KAG8161354.1 hypothetical protein KVR01_009618 [Diaporthe batatas]